MANNKNLISFRERSEEDKKRIQELGRAANKKKYEEEKALKKIFSSIGKTKTPKAIKEELKKLGFNVGNIGLVEALCQLWSVKIMSKKSKPKDIKDFIEVYARITGQEPVFKYAQTDTEGNDITAPPVFNIVPVEVIHDKPDTHSEEDDVSLDGEQPL